uniref:Uncharacterized protein n=1 Tax=Arundo donax TaxID=35708 RepID=A0A0A9FNP5_ARUDO
MLETGLLLSSSMERGVVRAGHCFQG